MKFGLKGLVASEEMSFESVDGRYHRRRRRWTTACPIISPEAFGFGELIKETLDVQRIRRRKSIFALFQYSFYSETVYFLPFNSKHFSKLIIFIIR